MALWPQPLVRMHPGPGQGLLAHAPSFPQPHRPEELFAARMFVQNDSPKPQRKLRSAPSGHSGPAWERLLLESASMTIGLIDTAEDKEGDPSGRWQSAPLLPCFPPHVPSETSLHCDQSV